MAKIILNSPITTDRYGLHFVKGEAHTDNEYLINRLIRKGVKVEIEQEVSEEKPVVEEEKTIDEMTVAELKEYAAANNIEIPSNIKNKADIVEFIKNYKEDDGEQEVDGEDEKPDNTETKPDNEDENPEEKSDEAEGEENPKAE
mgnify:CR=1 FL=1